MHTLQSNTQGGMDFLVSLSVTTYNLIKKSVEVGTIQYALYKWHKGTEIEATAQISTRATPTDEEIIWLQITHCATPQAPLKLKELH